MQIAILHDRVTAADAADAQDVYVQTAVITQTLSRLGYTCSRHACDLNLEAVLAMLRRRQTALVFNLVESLAGQGRLIHLLPASLEACGIPFTGSGATALLLSSNKLLAKQWLRQAGIATPAWLDLTDTDTVRGDAATGDHELAGRWIIKSVWEHASIGMDAGSVHSPGCMATLRTLVQQRRRKPGWPFFAEAYIDGREFNVSLLATADGRVEVLPAAEIVFDDFPADQPKIVDYAAKWDDQSFACRHTLRVFPGNEDAALLAQLAALALKCWHAFRLRGYARVDFRVDSAGRPWVLEVNANPCLAPDAGFAAALQQAGIACHEAVHRIITAALAGKQ